MSLLPMQLPVKAETTRSSSLESASQITTGAAIYFGEYTEAPILWRVVEKDLLGDTKTITLLSDKILENREYDSYSFDESWGHQNWSGSDICNYLNSTFLTTAFTTEEQKYITTYSMVEEHGYHDTDTFKPEQKIVLPSVNEVKDGGTFGLNDNSRNANTKWWLRSPGSFPDYATYVDSDGSVDDIGEISDNSYGVRPTLKLDLSSVLFTSVTDIEVPEKIDGIGNGISSGDLKTKLEEKSRVKAKKNEEVIDYTIEWDVENSSYDATKKEAQNFNVEGKILPNDNEILVSNMGFDTSVRVTVDAVKYNITYNLDEGIQEDGKYPHGEGTILPKPAKVGYSFGGWYTDELCTTDPVTTIIATDTGDKEYWAKWTANSYNITYEPGVGELEAGAPSGYTYGVGITLPKLTKAGYSFGGWYTNADCTGNPVSEIIATDTGDKTYWAKWTADSYKITYNPGVGKLEADAPSEYTYGKGTELPKPTKAGYSFEGWYTNEDCTTGPVTTIIATDTGNKTYWAKWTQTPIAPIYTVNFDSKGGNTINSITDIPLNTTITLPTPIRANYRFEGWYEGNVQYTSSTPITKSVTLVAKWSYIGTSSGGNSGGSTTSTAQKTTKERIASLSSSQKQAVAIYFKEELPYTTMNPSFAEEALKRLTDKHFTEAQIKEILGDKALLKELGIESHRAISLITLKPIAQATFTDVATNHWANEAIKEAAALGLVAGMPDGSFAPNSPLQVADTFTFLDRVLIINDINGMKLPRSTVEKYLTNKEHWAFASMASVASKLSEATLKTISELGDKPLSRELLTQVLYEATDGKLEPIKESIVFEDTANSPYKEAIDYCVRAGLISGVDRTHMAPTKSVTRAELMIVLIRLNNILK